VGLAFANSNVSHGHPITSLRSLDTFTLGNIEE
jgi:hypothetical protein